MEKLFSYQPGEGDLLMFQHKFAVEWNDGKIVRSSSALVDLYTDSQISYDDF